MSIEEVSIEKNITPNKIQIGAVSHWLSDAVQLTWCSAFAWLPWMVAGIGGLSLAVSLAISQTYLQEVVFFYLLSTCIIIAATYDKPKAEQKGALYHLLWQNRWRFLGLLLLYTGLLACLNLYQYIIQGV